MSKQDASAAHLFKRGLLPNPVDANFWLDIIKTQGVAIFLVIWFVIYITWLTRSVLSLVTLKLVPWITLEYFPAQEARRAELSQAMTSLTNAVTANTTSIALIQSAMMAQQQTTHELLRTMQTHDTWEREVYSSTRRFSARKPSVRKAKAA